MVSRRVPHPSPRVRRPDRSTIATSPVWRTLALKAIRTSAVHYARFGGALGQRTRQTHRKDAGTPRKNKGKKRILPPSGTFGLSSLGTASRGRGGSVWLGFSRRLG